MSKTRLYSIIAAIIIAVSIMLMGKACTNSILKANRETRKKTRLQALLRIPETIISIMKFIPIHLTPEYSRKQKTHPEMTFSM